MPLYEYQCESCHERFERIQKYSDPPIDVCPKCGNGRWNTITGGDSVKDPYPSR